MNVVSRWIRWKRNIFIHLSNSIYGILNSIYGIWKKKFHIWNLKEVRSMILRNSERGKRDKEWMGWVGPQANTPNKSMETEREYDIRIERNKLQWIDVECRFERRETSLPLAHTPSRSHLIHFPKETFTFIQRACIINPFQRRTCWRRWSKGKEAALADEGWFESKLLALKMNFPNYQKSLYEIKISKSIALKLDYPKYQNQYIVIKISKSIAFKLDYTK